MLVLVRSLLVSLFFLSSILSSASENKSLFSTETQIVPHQSYQAKLARDCRMFPKTFAWFKNFWLRGRTLQIPGEIFHHSPWLFEVALVKSLSHLSEEGGLLNLENLPEFMLAGATEFELHSLKSKIDFIARESILKIAFRALLEKCHIEFDEQIQKSFNAISINSVSSEEYYNLLVALAYRKTAEQHKKSINLEIAKAFLKDQSEDEELYKKQRRLLCNYIEAHIERASLLSGGDYSKRCEADFDMKSIIDVTWRIRFLVEHYSRNYHRQFEVFIKQKRFEVFYSKPLEGVVFNEKEFFLMNKFEIPKLKAVSKSLNSLALWDSAFHFLKKKLLDKLEDRSKSSGLTRYILAKLSGFNPQKLLESKLDAINQSFNSVVTAILADERFWNEFELEKSSISGLVGKNIFHQKECMEHFKERKKYYISQMKDYLIFDELKKDSDLIFPEATLLIAEPFKQVFSQHFSRLERSLVTKKPMIDVIPKMRTCAR